MAELRAQLHHRHRDPQHAAGGARQRSDRVLHAGRGPRRLPRRDGRRRRHLHQPEGPADRGLRLRPVRMSREETTMTDEQPGADRRRDRRSSARSRTRPNPRRPPPTPHPLARRLDREQREIKDSVLRMGIMVEEAIRAAIKALIDHDADAALAVIAGDGRINEAQRARLQPDRADHRDPEPGRARPALPALARPCDLRARAHRRPRRVGREAGAQAGAGPAARARTSTCRRWASSRPSLVHGILRALVDIDQVEARAVAARTTRSTTSTTRRSPRWSS